MGSVLRFACSMPLALEAFTSSTQVRACIESSTDQFSLTGRELLSLSRIEKEH